MLVFGLCLGMLWLVAALKLVVEVRPDELHVRFRPFIRRRIPYGKIARCEARTYAPLREYGGWGIRWGWRSGSGTAYTVSGEEGVQLELADGKRLLLGSPAGGRAGGALRAQLPPQRNVSP